MNAQELQFILKDQWRAVPGFEGMYEVSSAGSIRSLGFQTSTGYRKGQVLKASLTSGYPAVSLVKDGKKRTVRIHQIVCEAFHGPAPSPKHEVAHNDGVRAHSWASNLRWYPNQYVAGKGQGAIVEDQPHLPSHLEQVAHGDLPGRIEVQ